MAYLYIVTKFTKYCLDHLQSTLILPRICFLNEHYHFQVLKFLKTIRFKAEILGNFQKFIGFSVKLTPLDENVLYATGAFCSILEKQKVKSFESALFYKLLR